MKIEEPTTNELLNKAIKNKETQLVAQVIGLWSALIDKKIITSKESQKYLEVGEEVIKQQWLKDKEGIKTAKKFMSISNLFGL